jgi:disulfide bond formation protein DsbB
MKSVLKKFVVNYSANITFMQALVATLGSLYFSQVMELTPCTLCWYQRILMYPIVLLSATGIILKDKNLSIYTLVLSIPGALIALYHYILQLTGYDQLGFATCSVATPCTNIEISFLGFITIPLMSFVAFTIITVLNLANVIILRRNSK